MQKCKQWLQWSSKTGQTDEIVSKLNLSDDEYYYVYMELDTENGKYYPIEDVSLCQAQYLSTINKWYLYNYLDKEFVWNLGEKPQEDNNTTVDNTISKNVIPNTGKTLIISLSCNRIATLGIFGYRKMKEYYFIKQYIKKYDLKIEKKKENTNEREK